MKPHTPATTLHAKPSANFADKLAATQAQLKTAATELQPLKQASSLGAEDVVITHLINSLRLDIPVFVLETGALHSETLALLERLQAHSRAPVQVFKPEHEAVIAFVESPGQAAIFEKHRQPQSLLRHSQARTLGSCLARAKSLDHGFAPRAVASARRGVGSRKPMSPTAWPSPSSTRWWTGPGATCGTTSPLNKVDYNPLHDQFFPSIGCAPCTRAISLGEDFRAGRWWWEDEAAKECGLHARVNKP
jgi:phosphoadenosine phosphosulfate reductase